ncbi:MAG: hypothetical protein MJE66_10140 [Proteobacteria bacterium]|nr:hypothetical protein [Pseudomonadota bacterium]
MLLRRRQLVLVPDTAHHARADFEAIAARIHATCDDVRAEVWEPEAWRRRRRLAVRPAVVVAARHFGRGIRPLRGACLQGAADSKAQQYRRMEAAGVATIPWCEWRAESAIDPGAFGPYVITKPDVGSRGRDVRLRATRRLRFDPEKHGNERWLVQRFVHTGPYPVVHRVLTLLGRPLLHWRTELQQSHACHDPADRHQVSGHNPVASSASAHVVLVRDAEIERYASDLARRVYPDVPLLGLDVLRECSSGRLFCCELNPWGHNWHFSSQIGRSMQRDHGLDFEGQFNAFHTAADVLIQLARQRVH